MPQLGQTQYYRTNTNGVPGVTQVPYGGNAPQGYTPIGVDEYRAGLQAVLANPNPGNAGTGNIADPVLAKRYLDELNAQTGTAAPNYRDPLFSQFNPEGQPTEANFTPQAKLESDTNKAALAQSQASPPINTNQPSPSTVNATPYTNNSPVAQALAQMQKSGQPAPQDSGTAKATTDQAIKANTPTPNPTTLNVDAFFNPQTNQSLADQTQTLMDFLSPQSVRDEIAKQAQKVTAEANVLSKEKLELMNMKRVMEGTVDDLADEITKGGGMVTESKIQALAVARNYTLLKRASFLQDQISIQQDLVANETSLLQNEKEMANTQFTQRMGVYQLVQQNQQNMLNAARDTIKTLMSTPGGLVAYSNDPAQAAYAEKIMGFAPGTISNLAAYPQLHQNVLDNQAAGITTPYVQKGQAIQNTQTGVEYSSTADFQKQTGMTLDQAGKQGLITKYQGGLDQQLQKAQLAEEPLKIESLKANIRQSNASAAASAASAAKTRLETQQLALGNTTDKIQQKLEQDYRNILAKEVSSRSGTVGTEDAKVAQANHLAALMNQYYDPKTGNYNVPKSQYGELVLGLAGMLSKTGTPTDSQVNSITQKTLKGDIAGAIGYVTGSTPKGSSNAVLRNLADSIDRQARTAEQNREAGLKVLRGLVPTDLDPKRAAALEANTLVPFSGIQGVGQKESSGYKVNLPNGKSLDLGNFEIK